MVEKRLPASFPTEWPWQQMEQVIKLLGNVVSLLPSIAAQPVTPDVRIDTIIQKLEDLIKAITGTQFIAPTITVETPNRPGWTHGHLYITTATKPEQFPTLKVPNGFPLVVRALPGNTDDTYIGKSKADASDAKKRITLAPGEAVKLQVTNVNLVYGDAAVSEEGFEYFVEQD